MIDGGVQRISPRRAAERWWQRQLRHGNLLVRAADALATPGDTVVDIGADWGSFTGGLAWAIGPSGTVHSFEPNPADRESLIRVRDGRENIVLHQLALSDAAGRATLQIKRRDGKSINAMGTLGSGLAAHWLDSTAVEVETAPLDDVLGRELQVQFIKCDVEGHEYNVFRGAEALLRRNRPAILVEIEQRHSQRPIEQTFELLVDIGYDGFFVSRRGLQELSRFSVRTHQLDVLDEHRNVLAPREYVSDFVFVTAGRQLDELLAHRP
jgi:FkbM family methyltransferase